MVWRCMRFGFLRAVLLSVRILWNKTLCVLVDSYWHFRGSKFLHIQVQTIQNCWKRLTSHKNWLFHVESRTLWIVRSDYQRWEKNVTQENKKVFLKPQVYLFSGSKHEETESTEENGGSIIKDIIYIVFFRKTKFKRCILFLSKHTSPKLQKRLLHSA